MAGGLFGFMEPPDWKRDRDGPKLPPDPPPPPAHNGTRTSRAAAESLAPITGTLNLLVLGFIRERGTGGATCDEVEVALSLRHQTASSRITYLSKPNVGCLVDSGRTRITRSGRKAVVWVAVEFADQG